MSSQPEIQQDVQQDVQSEQVASSSKKKWWIIGILAFVLAGGGGTAAYMYNQVKEAVAPYEATFYPSTYIEGVDVSGKTKEEAIALLNEAYEKRIQSKSVKVEARGKTYTLSLKPEHFTFPTEEIVNEAYSYEREAELFDIYKIIKEPVRQDYDLTYEVNDKIVDDFIKKIEKETYSDPVSATLTRRNGTFVVSQSQIGYKLKSEPLVKELKTALKDEKVDTVNAKATYTEIQPKRSTKALQAVNTTIGTFTTQLKGGDEARTTNVRIATNTINGYLLMPGESFSFNGFVGDTTASKGYKPAGAYLDGEIIESYGGGVCQVSTTLYNSVIAAGIKPNRRFPHSMTVGYVPFGHDAAIAYGGKDFVFSNPYQHPVYVEGFASGSTVGFTLYSNGSVKEAGVTYRLTSEQVGSTPTPVKEEKDPTLPVGTKKVKSEGSPGIQMVTYRQKVKNGHVVSSEVISRDSYRGKSKIILVGTKQ